MSLFIELWVLFFVNFARARTVGMDGGVVRKELTVLSETRLKLYCIRRTVEGIALILVYTVISRAHSR